jgi:hypothetical protein
MNMSPCEIEISGVSGLLQIYGIGTALFVVKDLGGNEIVMRVHNCLYSQGDFTLISVSQLCGKLGSSVDFSLDSPSLHLVSSEPKRREITVPLYLDDGLFAARFEPIQVDDPRYVRLPKCDATPGGEFSVISSEPGNRWQSKVLFTAPRSARILVAQFDDYPGISNPFAGISWPLHLSHRLNGITMGLIHLIWRNFLFVSLASVLNGFSRPLL